MFYNMLRLIGIIIILIVFCIYTLFSVIICFFVEKFNINITKQYYHKTARFWLNLIKIVSGVKVHIIGIENIDESEPLFIYSNHRGFFDVIVGYTLLKKSCGLVAKDYFLNVPILNYWMKKIGCLFLDRKDIRAGVQMIINAINNIKNGTSMWIFPEGTRNKNINPSDLLEYKGGAFKIAEKSNAYILPMAFYGTECVFEQQKPFIKAVDIYVNIGKKFKISELNENEKNLLPEYCMEITKKLIKQIDDIKSK